MPREGGTKRAPRRKTESHPLEAADTVWFVPIEKIEVGKRLRPVDRIAAEGLAAVIKSEGHKDPIEVCQLPGRAGYHLVTGAHRLEAAKILGHTTIKALLVTADGADRRLREISENLWRKGLDPIDRAAFVAELHDLLKVKAGVDPTSSPQQIAGAARWQSAIKAQASDATEMISVAYGFTSEIGERLGLTDRTIRNDLFLHRGLKADVVRRLRGHPLASNASQLRALAKLSEEDQRAALDLIFGGAAKGAAEAVAILRQKPKPRPEDKAWSAFIGSWQRMSAARRKDALRELEQLGLPKGVRITFDGDSE